MRSESDPSSYLGYLPPVLWRDQPAGSVSLGGLLKIFEKMLTGIEDDVVLAHDDPDPNVEPHRHTHPAIAAQIGSLHQLFDPWTTPATDRQPFLPWLASWLDLAFPTVGGAQLWDEYQRRQATAQIAQINRQRGLKVGLSRYLDLYAGGSLLPRVTIDDGARLLTVIPQGAAAATVCGLVTQGPVLGPGRTVVAEGLMRPQCVAVGPDGSIFAGESPLPQGITLSVKNRVWRFTPAGEYHSATAAPEAPAPVTLTAPERYPLAPESLKPFEVRAIAVAAPLAGRPETVYVLEPSGQLTAVTAPYERTGAAPVAPARVIGSVASPPATSDLRAMAVDTATGNLVILDRGSGPGTPNPPKVITVTLDPVAVTRTPLATVIEPLSVLVDADGSLLIGDGGRQQPQGPDQLAGNLVRVDRTSSPWTEQRLLAQDNPLRSPAGIARTNDGELYVLDAGIKPFARLSVEPFLRVAAEPASVLRVQARGAQTQVSRITAPGSFVYPVGMAADGSRLVVCDPGQTDPQNTSWARLRPFEFDLVVHWTEARLPDDSQERRRVLRRVVGDITAVVEEHKPAHVAVNLITRS